ncbi:MAG: hypothetical protein AAFU85_13070 [Planctomycetota bacterium]
MTTVKRPELVAKIGATAGVDSSAVDAVLDAFAQVAKDNFTRGVIIPGVGVLRIVQGPDREFRTPFGQTIKRPGRPEFSFEPDTDIRSDLLETVTVISPPSEPVQPSELPEIRFEPVSQDDQSSCLENSNKTKVGGTPDWIQSPNVPRCCGQEMGFYGQFDSSICERHNLADAGMLYVFVCKYCPRPHTVLQFF